MYKILIRADGGKNIGLGHVMRTLVLAKELKKYFEVYYICKDNKELYLQGINKIESEGFKVFKIGEENLVDDIKEIQREVNAKILITDSYDVNEEYFNKMKMIFEYSGYIDDINICKLNVDFIINQNINADCFNYDINENTKLFLGTTYCLLRDEFRTTKEKIINNSVKNILLTMGGSDKDYNTLKVLKILRNYDICVHVVIGSAFEDDFVKEIYNKYKDSSNIKLYKNASMSKLMNLCDLAISSCGSTLYELSAMQVPTIGIVVASNQKDVAEAFTKKKLIVGSDDLVYRDINEFNKILGELISNWDKRRMLSENQKHLVNVNGAILLSKNILDVIRSRDEINGVF